MDKELDDLKEKIKKYGYKLVKIAPPMPRLIPCICGRKRIDLYYGIVEDGVFGHSYKCPKCGLTSVAGKTFRLARENWNDIVRKAERGEK